MFRNKKADRLNLSDTFLNKGANESVRPAQPVKLDPINQPIFPRRNRMFKPFLAILLLICSSVVAAYIIKTGGDTKKIAQVGVPVKVKDKVEERQEYMDRLRTKMRDKEIRDQQKKDLELQEAQKVSIQSEGVPTASKAKDTPAKDESFTKLPYKVQSKAAFYKEPSTDSRDNSFIVWRKSYAPFNALAEQNGFVYAVITDHKGKTLEGWLRKQDLNPVSTKMYESDLK